MKIATISDTHEQHRSLVIPEADILVCAGDITNIGSLKVAKDFDDWCKELREAGTVREVVLIAGNHDLTAQKEPADWAYTFENAIYLEHFAEYVLGLKFFGSPWTPKFGFGWAFNAEYGELRDLWSSIPLDTDVLVTHGPPAGVCSWTARGLDAGCSYLAQRIEQVKPKLHICGHIHEGYGFGHIHGTTVMNASSCNLAYRPVNKPLVIEI